MGLLGQKRGDVCFSVDIPLSRSAFGPCLTGESLSQVERVGAATPGISVTPARFAPGHRVELSGLVATGASGVSVSYLDAGGDRQTLPVDFATLTDEQARSLGAEHGAAAYFATLPEGFLGDGTPLLSEKEARRRLAGIEVTALGADGKALAPVTLSTAMALRYVQVIADPPLVAGGPVPPQPAPPTPAPPATAADALSRMTPDQVLASQATLSHAEDRLPPVGPTLLIGAGDTPGGDPYALAAFAGAAEGDERVGVCWGDERRETLHVAGVTGRPQLGGKSDVVVTGETKANVADVAVTYLDSFGKRVTASGSYGLIDDQVAKALGTEWTGGEFVAFMPSGGLPKDQPLVGSAIVASVIVTAFDADGKVLEVGTFGGPR